MRHDFNMDVFTDKAFNPGAVWDQTFRAGARAVRNYPNGAPGGRALPQKPEFKL
jgi:hypothetical protein